MATRRKRRAPDEARQERHPRRAVEGGRDRRDDDQRRRGSPSVTVPLAVATKSTTPTVSDTSWDVIMMAAPIGGVGERAARRASARTPARTARGPIRPRWNGRVGEREDVPRDRRPQHHHRGADREAAAEVDDDGAREDVGEPHQVSGETRKPARSSPAGSARLGDVADAGARWALPAPVGERAYVRRRRLRATPRRCRRADCGPSRRRRAGAPRPRSRRETRRLARGR